MAGERNPYVGPRPFEAEEAHRFFGRTREIRDVTSLVIAHRIVLLYSTSGAGKSSLINAGVVPALLESGYQVLTGGRVGGPVPKNARAGNVFAASLIAQWGSPESASTAATLGQLLDGLPRDRDEDGEPQPRAIVIDQFEEIFTAHPEHWEKRTGFFDQLREALDRDDRLRLVLALREEYLAQLDPYTELLPTRLRARFRLERLDDSSAREAVEKPLRDTRRSFDPKAADALVHNLRRVRIQTAGGQATEVAGEYVEPVQLQVVCENLWNGLPDDVRLITSEHLKMLADPDKVLALFYDDALKAAKDRAGKGRDLPFGLHLRDRVKPPRLRRWVKDELITPGGTRSTVYRGAVETAGLPNEAVDALEDKRLIRAEERAGAKWYELTHDRLIEPIRVSNERFFAERRKNMMKTAASIVVIPLVAAPVAVGVSLSGGKGSSGPATPVPAALTPKSLNFGVLTDPNASPTQKLTLSSGSGKQRVKLTTSGDVDDFPLGERCARLLAPGKTCLIAVRFRPTRLGVRRARVSVGAGNRLAALLTGTLQGHCGAYRWSVKTLADADASRVDLHPRQTTIARLVRLPPPSTGASRRVGPVEFQTYTVRARLLAMKLEPDSDVKVVIADPRTGATMVAKLPAAACAVGAPLSLQARMNAARTALVRACGSPSSRGLVTPLQGAATLTGVGFFDRLHGMQGQARNAIELHPVLAFAGSGCGAKTLLPDLVVRTVAASSSPLLVEIRAAVSNAGTAASRSTVIQATGPPSWETVSAFLPPLHPGETLIGRLVLRVPPASRRAASIIVTVDPRGEVREQNEKNNSGIVKVELLPPVHRLP
jgi:hypothetical protein